MGTPAMGEPGRWERAPLDGVELEYQVRGTGAPVVLLHNGALIEGFRPLLEEPVLTDRYRLVSYHRAGYAGSGRVAGPLSFAQEAARCRELLGHLGIARAHVVGHSSSGGMALQLALDAPAAVASLALLEPVLLAVPSPPEVPQALERYRAGDPAGAVDLFLQGTSGPDYRAALERAVPGAVDQAVADAATFFDPGAARPAAVGVRAGGRASRPPTGPRGRRRAERAAPPPKVGPAAYLVAERRVVHPPRGVAPAARAEPPRHGRGARRLLRPPPTGRPTRRLTAWPWPPAAA